jgi:hypothetical protein
LGRPSTARKTVVVSRSGTSSRRRRKSTGNVTSPQRTIVLSTPQKQKQKQYEEQYEVRSPQYSPNHDEDPLATELSNAHASSDPYRDRSHSLEQSYETSATDLTHELNAAFVPPDQEKCNEDVSDLSDSPSAAREKEAEALFSGNLAWAVSGTDHTIEPVTRYTL